MVDVTVIASSRVCEPFEHVVLSTDLVPLE